MSGMRGFNFTVLLTLDLLIFQGMKDLNFLSFFFIYSFLGTLTWVGRKSMNVSQHPHRGLFTLYMTDLSGRTGNLHLVFCEVVPSSVSVGKNICLNLQGHCKIKWVNRFSFFSPSRYSPKAFSVPTLLQTLGFSENKVDKHPDIRHFL